MPEELPSTINEAVKYFLDIMPEADKLTLKNTAEDDLINYHFGLGADIRNRLGLWGKNKKFLDSLNGYYHPVRIPRDSGRVFRRNPATIPREVGH
jgi:hypothetical protein